MNAVTKFFFVVIFIIANAFLFAEANLECVGPIDSVPTSASTCTIHCNGQKKTFNCPCGGISHGGGTVRCSKGPTFDKCFPFCNNNGGSAFDEMSKPCWPFCGK